MIANPSRPAPLGREARWWWGGSERKRRDSSPFERGASARRLCFSGRSGVFPSIDFFRNRVGAAGPRGTHRSRTPSTMVRMRRPRSRSRVPGVRRVMMVSRIDRRVLARIVTRAPPFSSPGVHESSETADRAEVPHAQSASTRRLACRRGPRWQDGRSARDEGEGNGRRFNGSVIFSV